MEMFAERYSCRAYDSRQVERTVLMDVLEAARLAPSACNRQPWSFAVIESESGRRAIYEAYDREWIRTAPALIVAFGHHEQAWHRPYDGKDHTDIDVAIAVEHICLAAANAGLGTCWVCNFDPEILKKALGCDELTEPIAIIPIGYPAEGSNVPTKTRKALDEIVMFDN